MDRNPHKWQEWFAGQKIQSLDDALFEIQNADIVLAMQENTAQVLKRVLVGKGRNVYTMQEFFTLLLKHPISILEIGPLNNPLFNGPMVKYFDVADAMGLTKVAEKYHLSTENVPKKIDFVSSDGNWNMVNESFDMVYSAHLLEHQPDLIRHL